MIYTTLPNTNIKVSKICLGTMTWGNQNNKSDSFKQMDYALDRGVNFFDTAELYPVPASKETQGITSRYIGEWLNKRQSRDKVVLASKIAGPGDYTKHIRTTGFSKKSIPFECFLLCKFLGRGPTFFVAGGPGRVPGEMVSFFYIT